MSLDHTQKIFFKRARFLYGKKCSCGECFGPCLDFYTDKPLDWTKNKSYIVEFIKNARVLCGNCWTKLKYLTVT